MAPYDNLPHFRKWLEDNIGHTSKSRNDMLILGDFIRYYLEEREGPDTVNFQLKYRDRTWLATLVLRPNDVIPLKNEIVVELTDDAISSVLTQCAFNEGSVLNDREQRRQG